MESKIRELMYQPQMSQIKAYLKDKKIELSDNDVENRMLFIDHFLIKNKSRIKKRARIRKKLSRR